ncbi:MAG: hypothetical protein QM673_16175 [Gordonia sp. (in: high G+C Gram-positive bacteria)]
MRRAAAARKHRALVAAMGGEDNWRRAEQIAASWSRLSVDVRLARQKRRIDGIGATAAAAQHLDTYAKLRQAAEGAWDDWDVPLLGGVGAHVLGLAVEVRLLRGQTASDYASVAEGLAAAWRVEAVRVETPQPGWVRLVAVTNDPLAVGAELPMGAAPAGDTSGVRVGRRETGEDLVFPLDQTSSVVGGVPGSGKSVTLNMILAGLAFNDCIQVLGVDCKRLVEFYDWIPRMAGTAGDQEQAENLLTLVDRLGEQRLDQLRGSGYKSWSRRGYSVGNPLIVVVIDECAELFDSSLDKKLAQRLVGLVSRGVRLYRAAGIVYILATQKPTVDVLPSIIRDNCANRLAAQCTTREQEAAILGPLPDDPTVASATMMPRRPGMVVVSDDAGRRGYGRIDFISESVTAAIAKASAPLRIPLSELLEVEVNEP